MQNCTKARRALKILIALTLVVIIALLFANLFYHMVWNGVVLLNNPPENHISGAQS